MKSNQQQQVKIVENGDNAVRTLFTTTASKNIYQGDTKYDWLGEDPIIFIGLEDNELNEGQQLLMHAQSVVIQALMQKYYYLQATLTEQEAKTYNQQPQCHEKQAYLQILLEAVEVGSRHMYIYDPVPAAAKIEIIGEKIAAMRAAQGKNPYAAALRAAVPDRIPSRIIGRLD